MVFRRQLNEEGNYTDLYGRRWEILFCEKSESMEWIDTGEVDEHGEPIYEKRIVINKGWDAFESEEEAAAAYGLTYNPIPEPELDNQEEID